MGIKYDKENILSFPHVRLIRFFMWTCGLWPGEVLGENISIFYRFWRKFVVTKCAISLCGQINYLCHFAKDMSFILLGQCLITAFLNVVLTIRMSLPNFKNYGVVIRRFFMSFHLVHYKDKSEFAHKLHTKINTLSFYYSVYCLAMMLLADVFYNAPPAYRNYKLGSFSNNLKENTTFEFCIYYMYPGFNPFDWFLTTTLINVALCYGCSVCISAVDLLITLMVFQIVGHVKILSNNLKEFPKPKNSVMVNAVSNERAELVAAEMYDEEENKIVYGKLVEFTDHHRFIVGFTNDVSDLFGPMFAVNYLSHLVSCCLLLLECTKGEADALVSFGPLTINIFGQLIQISVIFEFIGTVSEKLKDEVYNTPWECMDVKNRRIVCFLLNRLQTPIRVTAMKVTPVGVTTMAGILKTTFSYFTFLRTFE